MKSQLLYHSLPLHTKTTLNPNLKFSSFGFPSYSPAFLGKGIPIPPKFPTKFKYWLIKSHNKEKDTTLSAAAVDENDDDEFHRRKSFQVITGAVSIGLLLLIMGQDKAWALGPEGPLMEEFWENVRRYALYALTVSTGVLYAVFQPIYELLKNPISAVLTLIIIGGSIFIISQVLYSMVGVSDFSYEYAY